MKLLVETTGAFQLLTGRELIPSHRPSVVEPSQFLDQRIGQDQVKVLGKLTDEASDATFLDCYEESKQDRELAIDAYLSEFGEGADARNEPKRETAKERKERETREKEEAERVAAEELAEAQRLEAERRAAAGE